MAVARSGAKMVWSCSGIRHRAPTAAVAGPLSPLAVKHVEASPPPIPLKTRALQRLPRARFGLKLTSIFAGGPDVAGDARRADAAARQRCGWRSPSGIRPWRC